jgi:hypothetical protein
MQSAAGAAVKCTEYSDFSAFAESLSPPRMHVNPGRGPLRSTMLLATFRYLIPDDPGDLRAKLSWLEKVVHERDESYQE